MNQEIVINVIIGIAIYKLSLATIKISLEVLLKTAQKLVEMEKENKKHGQI